MSSKWHYILLCSGGEGLDVCCGVKLFPMQVPKGSCGVSGLLSCLPAPPGLYWGAHQHSPGFVQSCSSGAGGQHGSGSPAALRLCVCRAGVLQALLRAAPRSWQLLQHCQLQLTSYCQASFPEFPSPSLSWPTEKLKNF